MQQLWLKSHKLLVDIWAQWLYTVVMLKTTTRAKRTARADSNFVIYRAVCETGADYIGLTRKGSRTVEGAVKERWRKHVSRARNENRKWNLYVYLKTGGMNLKWQHEILGVVRGRAEAYAEERVIIKQLEPQLNDQYCG